jgi:hypothetical protein
MAGALTAVVLAVWVWLSGIGGLAFQNQDHQWRNAVLNDLISHAWPVTFAPTHPGEGSATLVYYIGFWLPAACVGKVFGPVSAHVALLLWAWCGVALACGLVSQRLRSSLPFAAMILVFFSGLDCVGTLIKRIEAPGGYPGLWPPVQHLEWWGSYLGYSAMTSQLFWVFNQSIPLWLSVLLVEGGLTRARLLLVFSLCAFFAPLPAFGFAPIAGCTIVFAGDGSGMSFSLIGLKGRLKELLTVENVLGGLGVLIVALLYLGANRNAGAWWLRIPRPIDWLVFFVLEAGLFLALVFARQRRNPLYYLSIVVLFAIAPPIAVGSSSDFTMRVSLPFIVLLMLWSAEVVLRDRGWRRTLMIGLLVLGAVTPLFEINRSLWRTGAHILDLPLGQRLRTGQAWWPELDHPTTLTADRVPTLGMEPRHPNFVTSIEGSLFDRYLMKK